MRQSQNSISRSGRSHCQVTESTPEPPATPLLAAHTTKREGQHRRHGARRRANHADRHPGPPPRHPCPESPPTVDFTMPSHGGRNERHLLSPLARHQPHGLGGRLHSRRHPHQRPQPVPGGLGGHDSETAYGHRQASTGPMARRAHTVPSSWSLAPIRARTQR